MSDIDEMKAAGYIVRPDPDAPYQPEKQPPKAEPAPQFGEPWNDLWMDNAGRGNIEDSDGHPLMSIRTEFGKENRIGRAVLCVNACAGVERPDKVRDLIKACEGLRTDGGVPSLRYATINEILASLDALLARVDAGRGSE